MRGYPDFQGPKVGVYLQPEWSAKEGTDKNFSNYVTNMAWGNYIEVIYAVPTGKTLYLVQASFACWAYAVANADLNQMCVFEVYDGTTGKSIGTTGGNGGSYVTWGKPIVITGGHTVRFWLINEANHNCNLRFFCFGYEV